MATAVDVCIVGGGVSGLSCAHALLERVKSAEIPPISIVVLEARDVVGGRTQAMQSTSGGSGWGSQQTSP